MCALFTGTDFRQTKFTNCNTIESHKACRKRELWQLMHCKYSSWDSWMLCREIASLRPSSSRRSSGELAMWHDKSQPVNQQLADWQTTVLKNQSATSFSPCLTNRLSACIYEIPFEGTFQGTNQDVTGCLRKQVTRLFQSWSQQETYRLNSSGHHRCSLQEEGRHVRKHKQLQDFVYSSHHSHRLMEKCLVSKYLHMTTLKCCRCIMAFLVFYWYISFIKYEIKIYFSDAKLHWCLFQKVLLLSLYYLLPEMLQTL